MPNERDILLRHARASLTILRRINEQFDAGGDDQVTCAERFGEERPHVEASQKRSERLARNDDEFARLCSEFPSAGPHLLIYYTHPTVSMRWLMEAAAAELQKLERPIKAGDLNYG